MNAWNLDPAAAPAAPDIVPNEWWVLKMRVVSGVSEPLKRRSGHTSSVIISMGVGVYQCSPQRSLARPIISRVPANHDHDDGARRPTRCVCRDEDDSARDVDD